jgi:hypothetical protein
MANKQFLKGFAFSNLAGSRFSNFLRLVSTYPVDRKFMVRALLNGLISFLLSLLILGDQFVWLMVKNKLRKIPPPLFALGHWRSGTTHLHNLLCLDERAGYTTTFQTVFPNHLFGFHKPLIWLMRLLMPKTRPVDNVPLDPNYPQEEEFGLANVFSMGYYNWWYFPKNWDDMIRQYLSLENLDRKRREKWKATYRTFIQRALIRAGKTWYVSKNPPNTARIKVLLEMFPDARFVYIHRNPYEVFVSSQRFFSAILQPLQLQEIDEAAMNQKILKAYCNLLDAYEAQKHLIPKNRLIEMAYAPFMENELSYLRLIYTQLEIKIPEGLAAKWERVLAGKKHVAKAYSFPPEIINLVNNALGERIENMGYERL